MPVWQKAMKLAVGVYDITTSLSRSEDYGLTSQIRRSANSISANIAEGFGRNTNKDKCHFYIISRGSAYETQSHLIYGSNVKYFQQTQAEKLISQYIEIIHDLNKLIKYLRD